MALREWSVKIIQRAEAEYFIKNWHYSGSLNGCTTTFCFGIFDQSGKAQGAAVFGKMAMYRQWAKYVEQESDLLELRRLALVDDTPRNAESFLIGRSLQWLKRNTDLKKIVSYADLNHGHQGIIYKASNFQFVGQTSKGRVILWNGKQYHDKDIRTTNKGKLKPYALRLRDAIEKGEAVYKTTLPKNIYVYDLRKTD